MLSAILACKDPYETAERFKKAGWTLRSVSPPESGDPLVDMELYGNRLMLGITEGYVSPADETHIGCGVEFYVRVPMAELERLHALSLPFHPGPIQGRPWDGTAFEVRIDGFQFMVAGVE